jgi:hypothetical protein
MSRGALQKKAANPAARADEKLFPTRGDQKKAAILTPGGYEKPIQKKAVILSPPEGMKNQFPPEAI